MLKATALSLVFLFLTACVRHDYMGEVYAPVDPASVRVFYDASRLPPGMHVIGTDRATADESFESNKVVQDMIKKAASVGADAILIEGTQRVETGSTTNASGQDNLRTEWYTDANGVRRQRTVPTGTWNASSTTTVQQEKVITGKFYKFDAR